MSTTIDDQVQAMIDASLAPLEERVTALENGTPPPPGEKGDYASWWWAQHPDQDPRNAPLSEYRVTSNGDSGTGTLRDALKSGNRHITFDSVMTIRLLSGITTSADMLIIDGGGSTVERFAIKFEGNSVIERDLCFPDSTGSANEDCLTFREGCDFIVEDCFFGGCTDGGLDIIWNKGQDVYGTIRRNHFRGIDKTCLIHSGDQSDEGGRYRITFRDNLWEDCYQRMPFCRDADIHIDGDRYHQFGEADGGGGGAKSGRNSYMLAENVEVIMRKAGDITWKGETVTTPRKEAVGPHQGDSPGNVRCVNCPTANVVERNASSVPDPPYAH